MNFQIQIKFEKVFWWRKAHQMYLCIPYAAYQKPEVENNHELIRRVIPKVKSRIPLPAGYQLLMSHVILCKKKLNDQSPFDAVSSRYGFRLINY